MLESIYTLFLCHFSKRMKWTKDHDTIFLRELILFGPWNYKYGSKERENCWERISESLNELTDISFKVTQKSVRDHYQILEKTYKKQKQEEDRQSEINLEETDIVLATKIATRRQ